MLAPPLRGLAILEILAGAGAAYQVVGLEWIGRAAHDDTAIVLRLHVLPQDELGGGFEPSINCLWKPLLRFGCDTCDELTKTLAIGRGGSH
jgi:hypothetical protein